MPSLISFRDEPEGDEDATPLDVTSDEVMIETNEIPDSEGVVRAEGQKRLNSTTSRDWV